MESGHRLNLYKLMVGQLCLRWHFVYVPLAVAHPGRSPVRYIDEPPIFAASSVSTTTPTTSAPSSTSSGAPGPTGSGTVADCEIYYKAQSGDSCWSIVNEKYTYLTQALLTKWNPSLGAECTLIKDQYYCVAIKTAQPMPGTVDTCTRWHLAADGDGCWSIEQEYGISATQFNGWNPRVGSDCANLWLGYYVCVGL